MWMALPSQVGSVQECFGVNRNSHYPPGRESELPSPENPERTSIAREGELNPCTSPCPESEVPSPLNSESFACVVVAVGAGGGRTHVSCSFACSTLAVPLHHNWRGLGGGGGTPTHSRTPTPSTTTTHAHTQLTATAGQSISKVLVRACVCV